MLIHRLVLIICALITLRGASAFAGVSQQAYVKASNTGGLDHFGYSVSISGDTMVIGAEFEASNAVGVNGDQSDNNAIAAGAAYVFVRVGGVWTQEAYLKASNPQTNDRFGSAVAISGDTVVVGAPREASNATGVNGNQTDNSLIRAGATYVFVRNNGVWTQQAYLKASNTNADDQFGSAVAISGNTVLIGTHLEDSNATGINGNQSDNSAISAGSAYVFVRDGETWSQQAYLKASNARAGGLFGSSVAASDDLIVIGSRGESSNATGVNGNQADTSWPVAGAAYVFARVGGIWTQQAYLKASNTNQSDDFGSAVAISGNTIVVGAFDECSNATGVNGNQADNSTNFSGAAYVFIRNDETWNQQAYLKATNTGFNDQFGNSLSLSANTLVVGAWNEHSMATGVNGDGTNDFFHFSGAAYIFVRDGEDWSLISYLKASNTGMGDKFGQSVAVSGNTVVAGAPEEESNATGVNGNQTNTGAGGSGAAYVFEIMECPNVSGDLNCDCAASVHDVYAFVQALLTSAANPGCPLLNGDMNADGTLNGADVQGFVAALTSP